MATSTTSGGSEILFLTADGPAEPKEPPLRIPGYFVGPAGVARANAIRFKLINVTNKVEQVLELTRLDRVLEFCFVRELLCLLHGAAVMSTCLEGSNPAYRSEYRRHSKEPCQSVRRSACWV